MIDSSRPPAPPTRRCWTLCSDESAVDVELAASDTDTLAAVLPAVGRALGREVTQLWCGAVRLAGDLRLSAPELGHGAVLGCDGPAPASEHRRSNALELHVVGGPSAGHTHPLGQGRHVIGRGGDAGLRLDDPDVSRRHAVVDVGSGAITVSDQRSTNGSRLDDRDLDEVPAVWPAGVVLRVGASALTVTGPAGAPATVEAAPGGRLRVRPTPRLTVPDGEVEVVFPGPPQTPHRRRLAWVAVLLPAVGGALMAWLLSTPTFLFFALLGPVVALGTWLSERWSGRRTGRREVAVHAAEVAAGEARVADAVRAGRHALEVAHPDPATLAAVARRRSHLLWSRSARAPEPLSVRVGIGPGTTRVIRRQADGSRVRETATHLPVVADLAAGGGLAIVGPRERAVGAVRAILAQLAVLHAPGDVDVCLLTNAARLSDWTWARWLPHLGPEAVRVGDGSDASLHAWLTDLVALRRAAVLDGPPEGRTAGGRLVVLVDQVLAPEPAATLRGGRDAGVLVLTLADSVESLPVPVDAVLGLGGETGDEAVLRVQGTTDRPGLTVDRMPVPVAAELARRLAGLVPVGPGTGLPSSVRLLDLPSGGLCLDESGAPTGTWPHARDRLTAVLGRSTRGPVELDLVRQGPHALVAGTTGSGKSELLQTLITSLALHHPPSRCSFLLVDYKGGAAFADAAHLPHTVGLVTDLDGPATERALRSLSAELTRREAVLARHEVADIARLPDEVDLARLVIVVDEFATLAEELPTFVPGLVGIAQRGRSLGVHLVLATQRPGGVVSPEIRANCTLRICLRTTDESDSRDVLGSTSAAHLPVDVPGRAFLRSGGGMPTLLQIARVATASAAAGAAVPEARPWTWPLVAPPVERAEARDRETDLARARRALAEHARRTSVGLPHRPWRPPLPDNVPTGTAAHVGGDAQLDGLTIGLVDRPDRQLQEPLRLDLAEGGAWLAVGGARSGRTTLLRTVLGEAVHRFRPDELHVHVLESGGGSLAADAAGLPHTGTSVSGDDPLRTVRLVHRLAQEVAGRRAAPAALPGPRILLLVDGVEALGAVLDEHDPAQGSAALFRLVRDGAAAGLTCVLTADRAVPGGRLAAAARQRLVLPLPDRADYAMAGIPARAVPSHRPPGRALLGEEAVECQLALPRPLTEARTGPTSSRPPLRIAELPADPVLTVPTGGVTVLGHPLLLPVGPGGDEGTPSIVDLMRSGGLLVAGPPGSGRSSALDGFVHHLRASGAAVLRLGRPPIQRPVVGAPDVDWLDPTDEQSVADWLGRMDGRPAVVVADDVGTPVEWPALTRLPTPGSGSGMVLIAAGSASSFSGHYQGPVAALRRARSGLLLCPAPGDADLLGVRLPRTPLPVRPGSGWLVTGGVIDRVQVALRREIPAPRPGTGAEHAQRSSSAGPISCRAYQPSS